MTDPRLPRMLRLWHEGMLINNIATTVRASKTTVRNALMGAGVDTRTRRSPPTEAEVAEICRLFSETEDNLTTISRKVNRSLVTIRALLRTHGVERRTEDLLFEEEPEPEAEPIPTTLPLSAYEQRVMHSFLSRGLREDRARDEARHYVKTLRKETVSHA